MCWMMLRWLMSRCRLFPVDGFETRCIPSTVSCLESPPAIWSKEPRLRRDFLCGWFLFANTQGRGPSLKDIPNFLKQLGLFFREVPLPRGWTMGNHRKRKPPPPGWFLSIKLVIASYSHSFCCTFTNSFYAHILKLCLCAHLYVCVLCVCAYLCGCVRIYVYVYILDIYIQIYTCTYIYVYTYRHIHIYMCVCVSVWVCAYLCGCACVTILHSRSHIYTYIHIRIYIWKYICIFYIYIHIWICVHIHTYIQIYIYM